MKKFTNRLTAVATTLVLAASGIPPLHLLDAAAVTSADLSISQNGIAFICSYEGFHSTCYEDNTQSSIGYGTKCTGSSTQPHAAGSHSITKEAAYEAMTAQIESTYSVKVKNQTSGLVMNQNQFDALVSFAYNTGGGTTMIQKSPLVQYLQRTLTQAEATRQYAEYKITSGGTVLNGLINRRKAEAELFFTGITDVTVPVNGTYFSACGSGYTSIVEALQSIGADSSYEYRKTIAAANGISDYSGSADQNTKLLELLEAGLLINPDGTSSAPTTPVEPSTGRAYNQFDTKWKAYTYNTGTLYSTGCGIFSFANAIYALNGNLVDVLSVAQWANSIGAYNTNGAEGLYRYPFYENIESKFGTTYNFTIGKNYTSSIDSDVLRNHLSGGGVAVIHVPNHFMAVTGWNSSNDTFHVIESAVSSSRNLAADSWVTVSQLSTGNAAVDWFVLINNRTGQQPIVPDTTYFPACDPGYTSLVEALQSIGADSSYTYRKTIAAANGISNYSGSADQNTQMLNLLKAGSLVNPDAAPVTTPTTTKTTTTTTKTTTTTTKTTTTTAKTTASTTSKATTTSTATTTTHTETTSSTAPPPSKEPVLLPKEMTIEVGETAEFYLMNVSEDQEITWISSNKNVAAVANGIVTGAAAGTVTIYAVVGDVYCEAVVHVTAAQSSTQPPAEISYGDVNQDNAVSLADIISLNKYLAGALDFTEEQESRANCCYDNAINGADATVLIQYIVRIISNLPIIPE